jgi:tetratricopeptide (TPR) repeat protein
MALLLATSPLAMAQDAVTDTATETSSAAPTASPAAIDPAQAAADALLAQRIAGLGYDLLRSTTPTPAVWRQAAALQAAAHKLDPRDPQHPKLQAEALIHAGDMEGAIAALRAYRQLVPGDQFAQVRLIDLYTTRFQVAEKRLAYLVSILDNPTIPPEVRSYAAHNAGLLHRERSQMAQAKAMFEQALRLNPLNSAALRDNYAMTSDTATPAERVGMLLRMMRANPVDSAGATELAGVLADAGLVRPSLDWYGFAVRVLNRQEMSPSQAFVAAYAAQFLLADRPDDADGLARQLLSVDPADVNALLVRLLANRNGDADEYTTLVNETGALLRGRVLTTRQTDATTRPTVAPLDGPLPDLSEDISAAAEPENADRRRALISALGDLAWFQLYFANRPDDAAKTIDALSKLASEDSVTLARLQGWLLLVQKRPQEATVKLSAVADRDPIAALGLARIKLADPATKAEGLTAGRDAVARASSGLLGAIVWDGVKEFGVKRPSDNGAEMIMSQLDKFPRQWLSIIDEPQTFYTLRGEPLRGTHAYGEPMFARITLVNQSEFDIAVGPDGVLKPDLWFNAQLRGMVQEQLTGVTYDRLSDVMVLRAKQSVTQDVRIDRGPLATLLASNPTPSVQAFVSVVTNPVATERGIEPGAAGTRVSFPRIFARSPFPINNEQSRGQLVASLNGSSPTDKFNALELIGGIVSSVRKASVPEGDQAQANAMLQQWTNLIGQIRNDSTNAIASWAWYLSTAAEKDDEQARSMRAMLSSEIWTTRLLGAMSTDPLGDARSAALQKMAAEDPEPILQRLAAAMLAANASTTQPAAAGE